MEEVFDARRVYLAERDQPHHEWRTVALISGLREALLLRSTTEWGAKSTEHSANGSLLAIVGELTNPRDRWRQSGAVRAVSGDRGRRDQRCVLAPIPRL